MPQSQYEVRLKVTTDEEGLVKIEVLGIKEIMEDEEEENGE